MDGRVASLDCIAMSRPGDGKSLNASRTNLHRVGLFAIHRGRSRRACPCLRKISGASPRGERKERASRLLNLNNRIMGGDRKKKWKLREVDREKAKKGGGEGESRSTI